METRFYDTLIKFFKENDRFPSKITQNASRFGTSVDWVPFGRTFDSTQKHTPHMVYRAYSAYLQDQETKRILFDSKQAAVFDEVNEAPPIDPKLLKTPFKQFYIEFTDPILLRYSEPGYHNEYARAMLYIPDVARFDFNEERNLSISTGQLTVFLFSEDEEKIELTDRSFKVSLQTGSCLLLISNVLESVDPSEVPANWDHKKFMAAEMNIDSLPNRHIGWWEHVTQHYLDLFMWMLAYMMSKSIVIETEWISRQVRRYNERHNYIPKPWHIVKLDPKIVHAFGNRKEEGIYRHQYRYDVVGHLRFQHQRIKDGHKTIIEWIRPHQRGLANQLYIPKTYLVTHGKTLHPQMQEYFYK